MLADAVRERCKYGIQHTWSTLCSCESARKFRQLFPRPGFNVSQIILDKHWWSAGVHPSLMWTAEWIHARIWSGNHHQLNNHHHHHLHFSHPPTPCFSHGYIIISTTCCFPIWSVPACCAAVSHSVSFLCFHPSSQPTATTNSTRKTKKGLRQSYIMLCCGSGGSGGGGGSGSGWREEGNLVTESVENVLHTPLNSVLPSLLLANLNC